MESELSCWLLYTMLTAVTLLYYYLITLVHRLGNGRPPPGPRPLPLIGNLLSMGGNVHHDLARLARSHGPVMTLKLGLTNAVVISSRDASREAFTKHDRRLAARAVPDVANVLGFSERSMIWLPSSDPLWKTLRGIVATSVFSPRSLAAVRGVRERKVRDMVSYFRGHAGQPVDVGKAVYGVALNIVSSALCSFDVGAESAQGIQELVEEIIAAVGKPNVSDLVPFLRPLDLQGWRRWSARRFEKLFSILDGIINHRLAAAHTSMEGKHGDFLDVLLELVSTGKIAHENLTTILFDVIAAGSDTISITVQWAMAELLRNASVMAKLRAEIHDALGGKETIGEPDVANLPYLEAVPLPEAAFRQLLLEAPANKHALKKKAIRLHPVAPVLLPHKAVHDGVEISGYTVPKGTTVIFNVWAIMRDEAAWDRPGDFVPERFLEGMEGAQVDFRGKDFELIPFGSGRRLCPGLPMAERVVPFIVASLLHAFEWRLPDGVSAEQLNVSERFSTSNMLVVPLRAVPVVVT